MSHHVPALLSSSSRYEVESLVTLEVCSLAFRFILLSQASQMDEFPLDGMNNHFAVTCVLSLPASLRRERMHLFLESSCC